MVEINGRKVIVSVEAGEIVGLRLRRVDSAAMAAVMRERGEMQVSPRTESLLPGAGQDVLTSSAANQAAGLSSSSSVHALGLGPRLRPQAGGSVAAPGIWEEEAPGVFTNRSLLAATEEAEKRASARRIASNRRRQSLTAGVMALWTKKSGLTPASRKARWDKLLGSRANTAQQQKSPSGS